MVLHNQLVFPRVSQISKNSQIIFCFYFMVVQCITKVCLQDDVLIFYVYMYWVTWICWTVNVICVSILQDLGAACGNRRSMSLLIVKPNEDYEELFDECKSEVQNLPMPIWGNWYVLKRCAKKSSSSDDGAYVTGKVYVRNIMYMYYNVLLHSNVLLKWNISWFCGMGLSFFLTGGIHVDVPI